MNIIELLKDELPREKLNLVPRSWDLIGEIAIVKLDPEVRPYATLIGKAIVQIHKNVRSVYEKVGQVSGRCRLAKYKWIYGEKNTVTVHKEHGCRFKLDINKVYFSPRLSNERKRIADQVKDSERILVMFSGVGPYPIVIAKRKKVKIHAIELNPVAYQYAIWNVKHNKLSDKIVCIQGDVREEVPKLDKFDRILMPLPRGAKGFLDLAFEKIKSNGVIHYYSFTQEPELFKKPVEDLKAAAKKNNKSIEILKKVKCGQYAPGKYRVCLDVLVNEL